jgi:hypothetical protein
MSYFLVFQEDLDDVDAFEAFRTIAKAQEKLSSIAEEIGVTPLSDFVTGVERGDEDMDDIAENEGWSGADYSRGGGEDEWFDANEGLDTVRALMGYVESDPESLKRPRATMEELRLLETALEAALQAGVKFRFEFDE